MEEQFTKKVQKKEQGDRQKYTEVQEDLHVSAGLQESKEAGLEEHAGKQSVAEQMDMVEGDRLTVDSSETQLQETEKKEPLQVEMEANKAVMSPSMATLTSLAKNKEKTGVSKKEEKDVRALEEKTEASISDRILHFYNKMNLLSCADDLNELDSGGSDTYIEVKNSLVNLHKQIDEYRNKTTGKKGLSACVAAIFRVNEAVRGYNASHTRPRLTVKGKKKKAYVAGLTKYFQNIVAELGSSVGSYDQETAAPVQDAQTTQKEKIAAPEKTKKEKKSLNSRIKDFRASFEQMNAIIGQSYFDTPLRKIKKRLAQYKYYEADINEYKILHRDDMSDEMKRMFAEIDELLREERVLSWMTDHVDKDIQADKTEEFIRENAMKNAERTGTAEGEVTDEKYDETLSPEQLKAIDEIDRWFLRNWNNGGLAGKMFSFFKAGNADMINELFSRSKRERLLIYYMIETRKRKGYNAMDIGESQLYVPTLAGFKKQMLASRFKVKSHMTSGYVYYHKVSEAMDIANKSRRMINSSGKLLSEEAKQSKEKTTENAGSAVAVRQMKLADTTRILIKLQKLKKEAAAAKKSERPAYEAQISQLAEQANEKIKILVDADLQVKREFEESRQAETREYSNADVALEVGELGIMGVEKSSLGFSKMTWGLSDMQILNANIAQGSVGSLGKAISGFLTLYNLYEEYKDYTDSDAKLAEETLSAISELGDLATGIIETVDVIKNGVESASVLATTSTAMTGATSLITATVGLVKMGGSMSETSHTVSAWSALKTIRERKLSDPNLSEEEKKKLKKQANHEDAVMKFSVKNQDRKFASGAMLAGAGAVGLAGVATASVTGVGIVFTVLGVAITLAAGIVDGIYAKKTDNAYFDKFMQMDEIVKKVRPEIEKRGIVINDNDAFLDQLRRKVASSLGFVDVRSACDHFSLISAQKIYNKLFAENLTDEERAPYIEMVKGLGLKYRAGEENKRKPPLLALRKAISGR